MRKKFSAEVRLIHAEVSKFIFANKNTKEIHERTKVENTVRF